MGCQGPSKTKQYIDFRHACAAKIVDEKLVGYFFIASAPKSLKFLFHAADRRQHFLVLHRFFHPLMFVATLVEILLVFKQLIADLFDKLMVSITESLSEQ